jgi:hypothetical protein
MSSSTSRKSSSSSSSRSCRHPLPSLSCFESSKDEFEEEARQEEGWRCAKSSGWLPELLGGVRRDGELILPKVRPPDLVPELLLLLLLELPAWTASEVEPGEGKEGRFPRLSSSLPLLEPPPPCRRSPPSSLVPGVLASRLR